MHSFSQVDQIHVQLSFGQFIELAHFLSFTSSSVSFHFVVSHPSYPIQSSSSDPRGPFLFEYSQVSVRPQIVFLQSQCKTQNFPHALGLFCFSKETHERNSQKTEDNR